MTESIDGSSKKVSHGDPDDRHGGAGVLEGLQVRAGQPIRPGMKVRLTVGPPSGRGYRKVLDVQGELVVLEGIASAGDGSAVLTHVRFLS